MEAVRIEARVLGGYEPKVSRLGQRSEDVHREHPQAQLTPYDIHCIRLMK